LTGGVRFQSSTTPIVSKVKINKLFFIKSYEPFCGAGGMLIAFCFVRPFGEGWAGQINFFS